MCPSKYTDNQYLFGGHFTSQMPVECGYFPINPKEQLLYLYLPIKLPYGSVSIPQRLRHYTPLVNAAKDWAEDWVGKHVYITAKTMFTSPGCPGNREGWHIDGFQSGGDQNFVWCDRSPTQVACQPFRYVSADDQQSMIDVTNQILDKNVVEVNLDHLYLLDETIVHRVNPKVDSGLRQFVKITVSRHRFANEGNSINYDLDYNWTYKPRQAERNLDHGN